MEKKVFLITGANAGIGKRAAEQLAQLNHEVIIVCRNLASGEEAAKNIQISSNNPSVHVLKGDMSSQKSIHTLAAEVKSVFSRLDGLIHNAANFDLSMKKPILTEDGVETIFATNHLGPFLLTNLLLDLLNKSTGRVITIASKGLLAYPRLKIEFDNLNGERKFSPAHAYYHSKMAQLMFTYYAAELYKDMGITFNCIRVPSVKVDEGRHENVPLLLRQAYKLKRKLALSPEEMAKTYVYLATSEQVSDITGEYFDENQTIVSSSKLSYDKESWEKLWNVSNRLTHIKNREVTMGR